jgi:uncharacterized protein YkwD
MSRRVRFASRWRAWAGCCACVLAGSRPVDLPMVAASDRAIVRPAAERDLRPALVPALNEERRRHGLAPLRENAQLSRAALLRLQDMRRRRYFGHYGPDGVGYQRIGALYPRRHGECLAIEWGDLRPDYAPAEALASLLHSPPHRRLLLGRFDEVGMAGGPVDLPRGRAVVYVVLVGGR